MIVPLKNEDGVCEWAIIELHGELLINEAELSTTKYVGDIYYLKCGTPVMIIGNHVLHGKEMKMDKPMAVLIKQQCNDEDAYYNVEYKVQAIINKKLLFKSRPKNLSTS